MVTNAGGIGAVEMDDPMDEEVAAAPEAASASRRSKLTLRDRLVRIDASIEHHQTQLAVLANRRTEIVTKQRVTAQALLREAEQA